MGQTLQKAEEFSWPKKWQKGLLGREKSVPKDGGVRGSLPDLTILSEVEQGGK